MKTKRQIFHTFNGKVYRILWKKLRKNWGVCASPYLPDKEREIILSTKLKKMGNEKLCEILIHEALHAEQWYLDEETVERIGESLSQLLVKFDLIK